MTVPRIDLDDLRYSALVEQALALVPRRLPGWTDHNPSDPGVTLIELLAYLTEAAGYTVSRYEQQMPARYAALLGAQPRPGEGADDELARAVRALGQARRAVTRDDLVAVVLGGVAVLELPARAGWPAGTPVTVHPLGAALPGLAAATAAGDDRLLALAPGPRAAETVVVEATLGVPAEAVQVREVVAEGTALRASLTAPLRSAHPAGAALLTVGAVPVAETATLVDAAAGEAGLLLEPVGLPERFVAVLGGLGSAGSDTAEPVTAARLARAAVAGPDPDGRLQVLLLPPGGDQPSERLRQMVHDLLRRRTVATTRLVVLGPHYADLDVAATVVREPRGLQRADSLRESVVDALTRFLDPVVGGADGTGWGFGVPVFRADLNAMLEAVPGVDHVYRLAISGDTLTDAWRLADDPALEARSLVRAGRVDVAVLDAAEGW